LALGPGASNGETQLAGDISVWVTRDQLAFSVRDAGVSRFLETGDVVDISVLAGFHPRSEAHLDFVIAGGLGISRGHHIGGAVLSTAPVAAFNTQLNLNYRVVGAALDGFAAVGPSRSYYGVGLALALGWFR
ncbi:MAG: hypothetical protein ACREPM_21685, partial [Gemmatimonadaceae bacterium]